MEQYHASLHTERKLVDGSKAVIINELDLVEVGIFGSGDHSCLSGH